MKVVYLVTTCAYCLQFIANYLTVLCELMVRKEEIQSWSIWLIYFGWLLVIGSGTFFAYRKVNNHSAMLSFAWALFYCAVASVILLVIFLILCASDSFKNFVYKQVCYNGN